jgi:hypothetical protein
MKEQHDLANLHPLLPGSGDPLPALRPDTINGFQIGGILLYYAQHLGTEVSDQLLRKDGPTPFTKPPAKYRSTPSPVAALPPDLYSEHGESALFVEEGDPLHESGDLI